METSYKISSTKYDRIVDAAKLDSVLGAIPLKFRASYEEACSVLELGLSAWRANVDLACVEAGRRIANAIPREIREETAITILVDHSGSMRGQRILLAAATLMSLTDWLVSLGIRVEVLGFTTVSWRGGRPRRNWRWFGSKGGPGRLCELLHIVYRKADETTPGMPWSIRSMLRADLPKENVDGEALEWAAARLREIDAKKRLLIVFSDGAPVDDSTIAANSIDYLPNHLRAVAQELEASGDISLGAVDICSGHSPEFYAKYIKVDALDDLGRKAVQLIEEMLLDSPPAN